MMRKRGSNPISPKKLWRLINTRGQMPETEPECTNKLSTCSLGQLPGISDGILFKSYGYEIWREDVDMLAKGQWVDDNVINVVLRYFKDNHNDVHVMDSTFAVELTVPKAKRCSRGRLSLSAWNLLEAEKYVS